MVCSYIECLKRTNIKDMDEQHKNLVCEIFTYLGTCIIEKSKPRIYYNSLIEF